MKYLILKTPHGDCPILFPSNLSFNDIERVHNAAKEHFVIAAGEFDFNEDSSVRVWGKSPTEVLNAVSRKEDAVLIENFLDDIDEVAESKYHSLKRGDLVWRRTIANPNQGYEEGEIYIKNYHPWFQSISPKNGQVTYMLKLVKPDEEYLPKFYEALPAKEGERYNSGLTCFLNEIPEQGWTHLEITNVTDKTVFADGIKLCDMDKYLEFRKKLDEILNDDPCEAEAKVDSWLSAAVG